MQAQKALFLYRPQYKRHHWPESRFKKIFLMYIFNWWNFYLSKKCMKARKSQERSYYRRAMGSDTISHAVWVAGSRSKPEAKNYFRVTPLKLMGCHIGCWGCLALYSRFLLWRLVGGQTQDGSRVVSVPGTNTCPVRFIAHVETNKACLTPCQKKKKKKSIFWRVC